MAPYKNHETDFHVRRERIGVPILLEVAKLPEADRDLIEKETVEYLLACDEQDLTTFADCVEKLYATAANAHEPFQKRDVDVFSRAILSVVEQKSQEMHPATAQDIGKTVLYARYINPAPGRQTEFPFDMEANHRLLFNRL